MAIFAGILLFPETFLLSSSKMIGEFAILKNVMKELQLLYFLTTMYCKKMLNKFGLDLVFLYSIEMSEQFIYIF